MNGLSETEVNKLKALKALAATDLAAAKADAMAWVKANAARANRRRSALRTVKNLHSAN